MNVNEYVWVKLTPEGEKVLENAVEFFPEHVRETARGQKEGSYRRYQMHDLMRIFGDKMYVGGPTLFEGNEIHFKKPFEVILPEGKKRFHVVLKRVYNVIVDQVEATSEMEAIENAELRCDTLARHLSGIVVAQHVTLDDGDEPIAALVDTYTEGGDYYEEESYYPFNGNRNEYEKNN